MRKDSFSPILILFIIFMISICEISAQRKPSKNDQPAKKTSVEPTRPKTDVSKPSPSTPPARVDVKRSPVKTKPPSSPNITPQHRIDTENEYPKRGNINYDPPERPPRKPSRIEQPERHPAVIDKRHPVEGAVNVEPGFCILEYEEEFYYDCAIVYDEIAIYYPAFPLRFYDTEINYLYSKKKIDEDYDADYNNDYESPPSYYIKDYYEINLFVRPRKFSYNDEFGVLISGEDRSERLFLFNEERQFMTPEKIYRFRKIISLDSPGYFNLHLGFFDSYNKIFYPAIGKGTTEVQIYVAKFPRQSSKK